MTGHTGNFVVVGGGIAGVSCAETLAAYLPGAKITIVTASPLVKAVRNLQEMTRTLCSFDVKETPIDSYVSDHPQIAVLRCAAKTIDHQRKRLITADGADIRFDKLCVCTGARPNVIFPENDRVLGIRDTITVAELDRELKSAERIAVLGNGGIATELVFQVNDCDVVWIVKDDAIGQVFFDPGAAQFFLPIMHRKGDAASKAPEPKTIVKRMNYELEPDPKRDAPLTGNALGPDWHRTLNLKGSARGTGSITVEYSCQVEKLRSDGKDLAEIGSKKDGSSWPLCVELSNGKLIGCDFLVSATGVLPNVDIFKNLPCHIDEDGGVSVDENMRVLGIDDVYAAGDVCSASKWPPSPHWQQMRLWTQARQMGMFAAQCMVIHHKESLLHCAATDVPLDICFSLFAHVTNFFGKKVCLLGRYNCQDLDKEKIELLLRTTPNEEYVKVILMDGRMQGAVLIGDTDLEETFENLILNETDLAYLGEDLLNPDVDIADYFD